MSILRLNPDAGIVRNVMSLVRFINKLFCRHKYGDLMFFDLGYAWKCDKCGHLRYWKYEDKKI